MILKSAVLLMTVLVLGTSQVAMAAWPWSLNSNPPEYIKDVVAYREGPDGLVIYFVLADASGAPTTADGELVWSLQSDGQELVNKTVKIKRSNFRETTVGVGAFGRKMIVCSLGRIQYSSFSNKFIRELLAAGHRIGAYVNLTFIPKDGKPRESKTTLIEL